MRRFFIYKKTDALAIHHFEGIQTFWWRNELVEYLFRIKAKSAHHEIRDFYAHMVLVDERRFARCFCRYSGNIA